MKRLLLAGGGHSHIEVVRRFGLRPPGGTEVVLASPARHAVYSGMVPGLIAGHYPFHACHVDLEALCRRAGVTFRQAEIIALDPARGRAFLRNGDELPFDWLSLDVGAAPGVAPAANASARSIPVRPVSRLLAGLDEFLSAARLTSQPLAVVGGGAAGVELAFAVHQRLRSEGGDSSRIALVTDTATILPAHAAAARRIAGRWLSDRGIRVHGGSRAVAAEGGALRLENGERLPAEWILWATAAAAHAWPGAGGLAVDARGFVWIDETLQSVSHPRVFAAGDCASLTGRPLPRSGVYAVRQGPVLADNLRNALDGRPLSRYAPQRRALSLIAGGDRRGIACWGPFALQGAWVWRWKDRIDRRFVARYRGTG